MCIILYGDGFSTVPAYLSGIFGTQMHAARGGFGLVGLVAWAAVGIPFLIGVWIATTKAAALF